MGHKIKDKEIIQWMLEGKTQLLARHWKDPVLVAYRARQLARSVYTNKTQNAWCEEINNAATLLFLLENDEKVRQAHPNLDQPLHWSPMFFNRCWRMSMPLLDIGPPLLRNANAVDTLDLLMREDHQPDGEYENVRAVVAKVGNELNAFYQRFQHRYALMALAWLDNNSIWQRQRPMLAQIMRHAAKHQPNDVLGAYLVWALDVVFVGTKDMLKSNGNKEDNLEQMQQLRVLAERVGLDTSGYDEHAEQCKTLHRGLGMELNVRAIIDYVQSVNTPAAALDDNEDLGALFG